MRPRSISEYVRATEAAEANARCCERCGVELGEGGMLLGIEPEAKGVPGVCMTCANMDDMDVYAFTSEEP